MFIEQPSTPTYLPGYPVPQHQPLLPSWPHPVNPWAPTAPSKEPYYPNPNWHIYCRPVSIF